MRNERKWNPPLVELVLGDSEKPLRDWRSSNSSDIRSTKKDGRTKRRGRVKIFV